MTTTRLILRSLVYHRRTNLGVMAAVAVAVAIIVGALLVGDSVRHSLRRIALARIGQIEHALVAGDRPVTSSLVARLDRDAVGVLQLAGLAVREGGRRRLPGVQIIGVTDRFASLAPHPGAAIIPDADGVVVNRRLADDLGVGVGDVVLFRIAKPSALPRDMPIGSEPEEKTFVTLSATISAIAEDGGFGRFSLAASQPPPYNAFVPLAALQEAAGVGDRVNLVFAPVGTSTTAGDLNAALRSAWTLTDAGAELRTVPGQPLAELRSRRVFLDAPLVDAARTAMPGGTPSLTYFVNSFDAPNGRSTPYSIVSTRDAGLARDEIEITRWLADDLAVVPGDAVAVRYYVIADGGELVERSTSLTIKRIVETDGPGGDRHLMPEFPGITDAESSRDWEPGIPIDLSRIRDKDEAYWKDHRGAPKAFVSLDWATEAWGNRYGKLTQVRWPADRVADVEAGADAIAEALNPRDLGLVWRDVRGPVLEAAQSGTDFGGLFVALSFFIVIAALLLVGLVFVFGVEQRASQMGTLVALGFTPRRVGRLVLAEGALVAVAGSLIGLPLGVAYTRLVLWGLSAPWAGAVAQTRLDFHASPKTLAIGSAVGIAMAVAAMAWSSRSQCRRSPRDLMASRFGLSASAPGRAGLGVGLLCVCGAIGLGLSVRAGDGAETAGAFFGAGALLLTGAVLLTRGWIGSMAGGASRFGFASLARRSAARRLGRSVAVVALLASGCFIVIAVNAFRQDPAAHAERAASGTGGFEWFATTTIPVLKPPADVGETLVPMRLREGDDASCLNLNKPQQPPLFGVDPTGMAGRFTFARTIAGATPDWSVLKGDGGDDTVPAIVDDAVAMWILKVGLGDSIEYVDEWGRPFAVRIVATLRPSILQGGVVIAEAQMKRRFPSVSGYRVMLVDAEKADDARRELEFALEDHGVIVAGAADRLRIFSEVQSVYMTIFGALGAFGVALGSVGLGLVVSRNVLERRAELAVMQAVGFTRRRLRRLILTEHALLAVAGIGCGAAAAAVAVAPSLMGSDAEVPLSPIVATLIGVAVSAAVWTVLAVAVTLRGRLIDAIRSE